MKSRRHQKSEKGIKVTYISSPMKVKTSASNFRALVQKLTGKCSNVAEANFMEKKEEARQKDNNGDKFITIKGSSSSSSSSDNSSSSLELKQQQQWRVKEEAALAWMKLPDYSSSSMVEPVLNEQLVLDFLGFDAF
ncbi:uncharacterized protein LOC129312664 [Prosopis cineraria]|uniref:uncharacterized protein LOC129312664 n=1 Tax=Prosopis cineraria TaxID=364024 RepID=UPI00240F4E6F|nr:uncharacterized protein LOC129312664 [Prosopis cineraria]